MAMRFRGWARAWLVAAAWAVALCRGGSAAGEVETWLAVDTDRDVLVVDGNDWMRGIVAAAVGGSPAAAAKIELAQWGGTTLQLAPLVDGAPAWPPTSQDANTLTVTAGPDGRARFAMRSRFPLQPHVQVPSPEIMARWSDVVTWRRIPCASIAEGIRAKVEITPDVLDPGYDHDAAAGVVVTMRYQDGRPFVGAIGLQSHPGYLEPREGDRCVLTFDGSGAPRALTLTVTKGTEVREGCIDLFLVHDNWQWFAKADYRVRCCATMELDAAEVPRRNGVPSEYLLTARLFDPDGQPLPRFPVFASFGKVENGRVTGAALTTDSGGRARVRVPRRERDWLSVQWLASSCVTQQVFVPPLVRRQDWVDLPRALKAAGAKVHWDESRRTLRAEKGDRAVEVAVGRLRVASERVGRKPSCFFIETPPRLDRGRLLVTRWGLDRVRGHLPD